MKLYYEQLIQGKKRISESSKLRAWSMLPYDSHFMNRKSCSTSKKEKLNIKSPTMNPSTIKEKSCLIRMKEFKSTLSILYIIYENHTD